MDDKKIHCICPVCGDHNCYKKEETKFPICEFCSFEDVIVFPTEDWENAREKFGKENDTSGAFEAAEYFREKYTYPDPRFSKKLYNERIQEQKRKETAFWDKLEAEHNMVHCPKCNSTQIQAVPRKFGLFAGVLTNKVDRVCLNCGKKF